MLVEGVGCRFRVEGVGSEFGGISRGCMVEVHVLGLWAESFGCRFRVLV